MSNYKFKYVYEIDTGTMTRIFSSRKKAESYFLDIINSNCEFEWLAFTARVTSNVMFVGWIKQLKLH